MEIIRRIPRKRKAVVSYRHHSSRKQKALLTQLMKYAVPAVLTLLTIRYQSRSSDILFGHNKAPLWCFVAATTVYWVMVGVTEQRMGEKWVEKLRRAALAFGILSVVSLLSMFLPYPTSLMPLLVWMPLALLLTWPKACAWTHRRIGQIQAMVVRARELVSTNKPPILPV